MKSLVRTMAIGRARPKREPGDPGQTASLTDDPFSGQYSSGQVLTPAVNPSYLTGLMVYSDTLGGAVSAMAQNIDGFGHQLVPRRTPQTEEETAAAEAEKLRLETFFAYIHPDKSLTRLRKDRRMDMEVTGRGAIEIIRSMPDKEHPTGEITGFNHIRSKNLRFCAEDSTPYRATAWRFNIQTGEWETYEYFHRFRRYVHQVNGQNRYFKSFGDPRLLDCINNTWFVDAGGAYITDRSEVPEEKRDNIANELWVDVIYDPDDVQGNPRWLGSLIDLENDRLSKESANDYLEQGGVPMCIMTISGGALDAVTYDRVNDALKDARDDHPENRFIIVEIQATKEEGGPLEGNSMVQPKIEVIKLNDLQRSDDSMFLNLQARSSENVLRPFRINSLFLGKNGDQSFATANISMQLNESQVFAPERSEFDWFINFKLFPELNATWWLFQSLGPKLEDNTTWESVLRMAIEFGAVPDYETLRAILSEVLGYKLPTGDKEGQPAEWERMPPGFVKSLLMVVQGLPQFADLEDALANVAGAAESESTTDGIVASGSSARSMLTTVGRGRAHAITTEAVAAKVVTIMLKAREKLADQIQADGD
jgi:capsid portal protein